MSVVYFVQHEGKPTAPIKIGYSRNFAKRHHDLELQYCTPLTVLRTLPGGQPEEKRLHAHFASLQIGRSEQFRPGDELLKFIANGTMDEVPMWYPPVKVKGRIGRPKTDHPTTQCKVTNEAKALLRLAAELDGVTAVEWLSVRVMEEAKRQLGMKEAG